MSDFNLIGAEKRLAELKEHLAFRDLVQKLHSNREFKKVILEKFMIEECARYAQASADPNLAPNERADALALSQAAGHLKRFFRVAELMGNQAEHEIPQFEEMISELRAEEVAE